MNDDTITARYVYRSEIASDRHRRRVSWYLVARLEGSNVVARIEPIGLMPSTRPAAPRARRDGTWFAVGPWQQTPSRHHSRVRVDTSAAS